MDPEIVQKAKEAKWKVKADNVLVINIEKGDTGYSFEKLFSPFILENLKKVSIQDPYLYSNTHKENWDNFLNVLLKYSKALKTISLETKRPDKTQDQAKQKQIIEDWENKFKSEYTYNGNCFKIKFEHKINPALHKRKVVLTDYGIVIDLDRGLDLFCPKEEYKNFITSDDWKILENRPCRETEFTAYKENSNLGEFLTTVDEPCGGPKPMFLLTDPKIKGYVTNILASDSIVRENLSVLLGFLGIEPDHIAPNLRNQLLLGFMDYPTCFKKIIDVWSQKDINNPPTVQELIKTLTLERLELNNCANKIAQEYELKLIKIPNTGLFTLQE